MKKIFIFAMLVLPCIAKAQHRFEIGATGGVNFSEFYDNPLTVFFLQEGARYRFPLTTLRYGIAIKYNITPKFGLAIELNKESRGFDDGIPNIYNYTSFPFITTYRFGKQNQFNVDFGGHLAIKTSGSRIDPVSGQPDLTYLRCPECNNGRLDWGFIAGFGYTHALTDKLSVNGTMRLNLSLSAYEPRRTHHYAVAPLIGISYGLGRDLQAPKPQKRR
jgi:hypothetical protein